MDPHEFCNIFISAVTSTGTGTALPQISKLVLLLDILKRYILKVTCFMCFHGESWFLPLITKFRIYKLLESPTPPSND